MTLPPRQVHLHMMSCPRLWPCRPYLPLVRRRDSKLELGLLCCAVAPEEVPDGATTVFRSNLLLVPSTREAFLALPREVFGSLDALYDAGWRVD